MPLTVRHRARRGGPECYPRFPANWPSILGPVASVYLEVSRDRGAAPHEVRLRWEALAAELRGQGAEVLEQFAQELRFTTA